MTIISGAVGALIGIVYGAYLARLIDDCWQVLSDNDYWQARPDKKTDAIP